MGATKQPSVQPSQLDPDQRAELVEHVLDWQHRHPLAARLLPHEVDSIGLVAVPFVVPAESSVAEGGRADTPATARRSWRRAFDERLVDGLSPARLARWALRHGSASRPPGGALRVREVVIDAGRAGGDLTGTTTVVLWLQTARLKTGNRVRRLLVAPDGRAVLGSRVWAPGRSAAAAAMLTATLGAAALVPRVLPDGSEDVARAPLPGVVAGKVQPAPRPASAAAPAALAVAAANPAPAVAPEPVGTSVPATAVAAQAAEAPAASVSAETAARSAVASTTAPPTAPPPPAAATATGPATLMATVAATSAAVPAAPPAAVAPGPVALAREAPPRPAVAAVPAPDPARAAARPASAAPSIRPHLADAAVAGGKPGARIVPVLDEGSRAAARAAGAEARRALAERRAKDPDAVAAAGPGSAQGTTPGPAPSAAAPAADAATAGLAAPPTAADTVWALSTRVTRTRFESEQVLVAMRDVAQRLGPPDAALRFEVLPSGADFRGVSWPFPDRRSAERVRSHLQARGVAVELVAF